MRLSTAPLSRGLPPRHTTVPTERGVFYPLRGMTMTEQTAHEPLTPERARCARVIRKAICENFAMTEFEAGDLGVAVEAILNDEQTRNGNDPDIQDRIYADIYDALMTVEAFELPIFVEADDQLNGIAVMASSLSKALNDLCNSRHSREQVGGAS